jgi:flagellar M-ring protein FliF
VPRQVTAAWKRISDTIGGFTFAQKTLAILALMILILGTAGVGFWLTRPN